MKAMNARLVSLFTLFYFASPAASVTTALAGGDQGGTFETAREILANEIAPKVPGLSVAVAIKGAVIWEETFGYADLQGRIPVGPKTQFRIGSISKSLVAAGLARMVERGEIEWDSPIQTYIPDFPQSNAPITIRLLAGHLSGIRNYRDGEAVAAISYPDTRSRLKAFENDALVSQPGERFGYASYNWDVIEVAMENAAREDFLGVMRKNVLQPLCLFSTDAEQSDSRYPVLTRFYEVDDSGAFVPAPPIDVRFGWAARGYLSTADDLVRFASALLHPGFLKQESIQSLFTTQATRDGEPTGYGIGWYVHSKPNVVYHSGWTVGGLSILLILPDSEVVIAILTNRGGLGIAEGHPLFFDIEQTGYKVAQVFAETTAPPFAQD